MLKSVPLIVPRVGVLVTVLPVAILQLYGRVLLNPVVPRLVPLEQHVSGGVTSALFVLACALFIRRMSELFSIEMVSLEPPVLTFRLYGALFFGAAAKLDPAVQAIERAPRGMTVVLDALHLISLDATGLDALRQIHKAVLLRDGVLRIESLQPQPLEVIVRSGFADELTRGATGADGGEI